MTARRRHQLLRRRIQISLISIPSTQTLAEYVTRPSWNVAGVDYAVGIQSGVTLKDPGVNAANLIAALGSGNVSFSGAMVHLNGNNLTIEGWDFSLHGGYGVEVAGDNNTISNNNFALGANHDSNWALVGIDQGASNTTVINNVLDGNGLRNSQIGLGLINTNGSGTTTIEYNWIKDAYSENIVMGSYDTSGFNLVLKYNVIENMGLGTPQGAHGDWMQVVNVNPNSVIDSEVIAYNTFIQSASGSTANGQGLTFPSRGAVLSETVAK